MYKRLVKLVFIVSIGKASLDASFNLKYMKYALCLMFLGIISEKK